MSKLVVLSALVACSSSSTQGLSSEHTSDAVREPVPLRPGERAPSFTQAEYASHIRALRAKLRKQGLGHLSVRIEDPFVVIGDDSIAQLEKSSLTVRWAADRLEQDFFDKRPTKILDIYLFSSAASYEDGVRTLTGEAPSTPYGFYSSSQGGMFMNIATGGGTLVHEIVHPYVEADFPTAPPWLNEGLGSLFEQSSEQEGHIVGLTNWRLGGLQRTIARGNLQAFDTLTRFSNSEFYGDETGTNYAQSRYLLYYLQEQGNLRAFYRAFRAAHAQDPTGYKTLAEYLHERDMGAFKRRWERYVAALSFP